MKLTVEQLDALEQRSRDALSREPVAEDSLYLVEAYRALLARTDELTRENEALWTGIDTALAFGLANDLEDSLVKLMHWAQEQARLAGSSPAAEAEPDPTDSPFEVPGLWEIGTNPNSPPVYDEERERPPTRPLSPEQRQRAEEQLKDAAERGLLQGAGGVSDSSEATAP